TDPPGIAIANRPWPAIARCAAASKRSRKRAASSPGTSTMTSGSILFSFTHEVPMSEALPVAYVARHGETAWSLTGQHTGLTDLPLTQRGERNAVRLGERLRGLRFAQVFTSPLQRARRTCELAGFGTVATVDPDLLEWNYGEYEGVRSAEIL